MPHRDRETQSNFSEPTSSVAIPPGTPNWITSELIEQTFRTWQPYYKESLTVDDAIAMIRAAGRMFEALSGN